MKNRPSIGPMIKGAFKENYKPGLVLQGLALAVVLTYYLVPSFQDIVNILGEWKLRYGYLYSALATALFGGLFPFLLMLLSRRIEKSKALGLFVFYLLFWAWKGAEVDLLYRLQAQWHGNNNHWWVIMKKVITDQGIYVPIWGAPTMTLFYLWKDAGFSIKRISPLLEDDPLFHRILRVLCSNLVVWVPAVTIVYMLPLPLQIPLFNLVLVFWTLILNSVAQK